MARTTVASDRIDPISELWGEALKLRRYLVLVVFVFYEISSLYLTDRIRGTTTLTCQVCRPRQNWMVGLQWYLIGLGIYLEDCYTIDLLGLSYRGCIILGTYLTRIVVHAATPRLFCLGIHRDVRRAYHDDSQEAGIAGTERRLPARLGSPIKPYSEATCGVTSP